MPTQTITPGDGTVTLDWDLDLGGTTVLDITSARGADGVFAGGVNSGSAPSNVVLRIHRRDSTSVTFETKAAIDFDDSDVQFNGGTKDGLRLRACRKAHQDTKDKLNAIAKSDGDCEQQRSELDARLTKLEKSVPGKQSRRKK